MKAWIMCLTLVGAASAHANSANPANPFLICSSDDGQKSVQLFGDNPGNGAKLNDNAQVVSLQIVSKEYYPSRVGSQVNYILQDELGAEANLNVYQKSVFVPGRCTRVECEPGSFKVVTTARFNYAGQTVNLDCNEKKAQQN